MVEESLKIKLQTMSKEIGRNDKCYCGSNRKYKKCCMNKDELDQKHTVVAGTLRRAFNIKSGDDFFTRYLFGLNRMKDAVCPKEKRLEYDNSFAPVFQNLLEAKYAREYAINLMDRHNSDIQDGKDGIIQGQQLNINNPIDNELNMFFKDMFIRGTIAIDCLIKHTQHMGYGISFLFSDSEEKFKKGLKGFPIPETDERFSHLKDMIYDTRKVWYAQFREIRRKIEHNGYKLPDVKHSISNGKVTPIYPQIGNQSIREILDICWQNLSTICEEVIVYIIHLKLPPHLMVVMIPPENRDPSLPVKYAVRHRSFPDADYSHS